MLILLQCAYGCNKINEEFILLQLCGLSTIKQFYFTFILVLLQLCGPL